MPNLPQRKISQDPIFPNLLGGDRVLMLRTPQDEPDLTKRNGTASLETLAVAISQFLPANVIRLSIPDANQLLANNAPDPQVQEAAWYTIDGDWNAMGNDTRVYLSGLNAEAFSPVGILHDAQGAYSFVQVDVANATALPVQVDAYTKAESDVLLQVLANALASEATTRQQADALKADLVAGKVPASQLPSYVDDVLEYSNFIFLPQPGETGKIYVVLDTNKVFRWSGSVYIEIAKSIILYPSPGPDTDGAMTRKATTDALARKTDMAAVQNSAGASTAYDSAQLAVNATTATSTVLLRGAQAPLTVGLSATLDAYGANWGVNALTLLPYPVASALLNIVLRGGSSNGRVVVVRQNATCSLRLEDFTFGVSAWLEMFALGGDSTAFTEVTLVRCHGAKTSASGQNTPGNIIFQSRNDQGQRFTLTLIDCDFTSTAGPNITGPIHPESRIYLQGTTRLTPASGQPTFLLTNISDSSAANLAAIVVDQRTSGGSTYTAGTGIAISGNVISATGSTTGIDYMNPVQLSAAATLTANKAYTVSGNGYTLTLPDPAASIGAVIFVLIASAATGLYPLSGTSYSLYARESLTLRAGANGWTKVGGELLAMTARLETSISQQDAFPAAQYNVVPFSIMARNSGLPGLVAAGTPYVTVQRNGFATLNALAVLKNCTVNGQYYTAITATLNGTESLLTAAYATVTSGGDFFGVANLSYTGPVAAGAQLRVKVYCGQDANLAGQQSDNVCAFSFTETV